MSTHTNTAVASTSFKGPRTKKRSVEGKSNPAWGVAAWAVGLLFVSPVLFMFLTSFHARPTRPPTRRRSWPR